MKAARTTRRMTRRMTRRITRRITGSENDQSQLFQSETNPNIQTTFSPGELLDENTKHLNFTEGI